jgi:hypothetical protein
MATNRRRQEGKTRRMGTAGETILETYEAVMAGVLAAVVVVCCVAISRLEK